MARLFTVRIVVYRDTVGHDLARMVTTYEADIANLHFSRTNELELKLWVRVAAQHVYGKDSQVIFLHEERAEQ